MRQGSRCSSKESACSSSCWARRSASGPTRASGAETAGPGRDARLPLRLRDRRDLRPAPRAGARRGRAPGRRQVAGPVHRRHARRDRRRRARARARAAVRVAALGRASRCRSPASRSWILGWLGFRIVARQSVAVLEMLGLSTRPLVRAQAVRRPRRTARRHVGASWTASCSPLARAGVVGGDLMVAALRARRGAGLRRLARRRRGAGARVAASNARGAASTKGVARVFVLDDEVAGARRGRRQAHRARTPAAAAAAHQRRSARAQRRAAGRADVQPPPASRRSSHRRSCPATSCGSR